MARRITQFLAVARDARFFTRKAARRMLEANGFEIIREMMTVIPLELILGLAPQNPVMRFLTRFLAFCTSLLPELLGYQAVFVTRRKPAAVLELKTPTAQVALCWNQPIKKREMIRAQEHN